MSDSEDEQYRRRVRRAEYDAERRLRKGLPLGAPLFLPYKVLAWTCKCGTLKSPLDIHRGTPNSYTSCPCERAYDQQREQTRAGRTDTPARRARRLAWTEDRQQATRPAADRHGNLWTGPELEIATRPDLTATEAALMLGRTLGAVQSVRHRCAREPKYAALLGAMTDDSANPVVPQSSPRAPNTPPDERFRRSDGVSSGGRYRT